MINVEKMITDKYPKLRNNKIIKGAISKFADSIVHQEEINSFLQKNSHLGSFEFIDEILEYFNFNFSVSDKDIQNIPASGRVVIIANHPLGGLDAFALIKLLSRVRKDIKVIANDFLDVFEPTKPILINVNNFKSRQKKESISAVYEALDNEMAVVIFPSGEVSRASTSGIKDKKWHKGFLKFAQRSNSPILPIFIGGKNSKTFYSVSAINKKLSTLLLSNEMFKQKDKSINILVGEIIPNENIAPKGILQNKLIELYKKQIYNLQTNKSYFLTQKAIAHPEDRRDIKKELKASQLLGSTKDGKKIQGLLIGMNDNDLSVIIGNAADDGDINHRTFISGSVIAKMTLGEIPFDIGSLRIELEKVFKKSGVRYFAESRTIVVMDRYRVTESSVEGDEGPIGDRIKRIWSNFKAEQDDNKTEE